MDVRESTDDRVELPPRAGQALPHHHCRVRKHGDARCLGNCSATGLLLLYGVLSNCAVREHLFWPHGKMALL